MNRQFIIILMLMWHLSAHAHEKDTFQVYFRLADRKLDNMAARYIDSLVYNDIITLKENLIILGYADYLGSVPYNMALSKGRAGAIKQYLLQSGFDSSNITICIGKGKIERNITGKAGYLPDRKVQIIKDRHTASVKKDIDLSTLKPSETLVLENIYFLPGRHAIREESMPALNKLFEILEKNKRLSIQIEGHVCCTIMQNPNDIADGYDYDLNIFGLSRYRAKAIYDYLVQRGIDPGRLKYVGLGGTKPLVEEITESDRNKNRRVEIRVLKN